MTEAGAIPPSQRPVSRRGRFAVIVPSTNTVVEHDYNLIAPRGVTFHAGRMFIDSPTMGSDEDFMALIGQIRESIQTAVRDVMTCEPDRMVMGMSAETFWDGVEGNRRFVERIREQAAGLEVTTGASACREALDAFGAQRIAVFSPYQPVADDQVGRYFAEAGFSIATITGLRCPTATSIAEVPEDVLIKTVMAIDADDVDAVVQVGTNLPFVRTAAACERVLGKPVIAINAATLWHALRHHGLDDQFDDYGRLLREH